MRRPERSPIHKFRAFEPAGTSKPAASGFEPPSGVYPRRLTLDLVPRLALSRRALLAQRLDHRAGFILSLIDGECTVETILDLSAMSRAEALRILRELAALGVVDFN
jgi:hypothetical protein